MTSPSYKWIIKFMKTSLDKCRAANSKRIVKEAADPNLCGNRFWHESSTSFFSCFVSKTIHPITSLHLPSRVDSHWLKVNHSNGFGFVGTKHMNFFTELQTNFFKTTKNKTASKTQNAGLNL